MHLHSSTYHTTHHFTEYSELVLDETTGRLEEKPLKSTLTFVPPDLPTMPFLDPRDDHLPQLVNEKVIFYRKMLHNLVESFKEKKYIFIEGKTYGLYLLHMSLIILVHHTVQTIS